MQQRQQLLNSRRGRNRNSMINVPTAQTVVFPRHSIPKLGLKMSNQLQPVTTNMLNRRSLPSLQSKTNPTTAIIGQTLNWRSANTRSQFLLLQSPRPSSLFHGIFLAIRNLPLVRLAIFPRPSRAASLHFLTQRGSIHALTAIAGLLNLRQPLGTHPHLSLLTYSGLVILAKYQSIIPDISTLFTHGKNYRQAALMSKRKAPLVKKAAIAVGKDFGFSE